MDGEFGGEGLLFQIGDDVAVYLADVQRVQPAGERFGERTETGADFYDGVGGFGADGVYDGGDNALVLQEVLSEAFAGLVCGHGGFVRRAKRAIVLEKLSGCLNGYSGLKLQ